MLLCLDKSSLFINRLLNRVAGAIENEPARVFGAMHSSGSNPLKVGEVVAKYECNHENEKHILQYVEHQFGQIFLAVSHLPA